MAEGPTFYLGVHVVAFLGRTAAPLFVSRRRLAKYRPASLPRALGPWALDSGGFTELSTHGRWTVEPARYADEARLYSERVGRPDFAATQDWMCEPVIIEGGTLAGRRVPGTGLSVAEHQARSVASYLELTALAPEVPWVPVLQGWAVDDYLRCAELYEGAGVRLAALPRVGVGSVCRRQGTREGMEIFQALRPLGLSLHGFGLKTLFVRAAVEAGLASFDSMAWSLRARKDGKPLEGCSHRNCGNCLRFAERWREGLLADLGRPAQKMFALEGEACA